MNILAIETSCDETACAILKDNRDLLSNVVVSQIDIFKSYGGVIPEVAARSHLEAILPVIDKAFSDAKLLKDGAPDWDKIDYIAVTNTPGLLGSLLIGTLTARTLAILHNKPLYAVHHLKSHIYSNWLIDAKKSKTFLEASKENPRISGGVHERTQSVAGVTRTALRSARLNDDGNQTGFSLARENVFDFSKPQFPLLALVISGGHTQIIYMPSHNSFEIIGTTLDDAVGECFDKVAKILGLPYPGGPSISEVAKSGNPTKYVFPHPKTSNPLDFSFSGLKTAVLRAVQKEVGVGLDFPSFELKNRLSEAQKADFSASFEKTAVDILLEKLSLAHSLHPEVASLLFAGGVSANQRLRLEAKKQFKTNWRCPKPDSSYEEHFSSPSGFNNISSTEASSQGVSTRRSSRSLNEYVVKTTRRAENRDEGEESGATPQLFFPPPCFSGDNAAMVAIAAYYEITSGVSPTDPYKLTLASRKNLC